MYIFIEYNGIITYICVYRYSQNICADISENIFKNINIKYLCNRKINISFIKQSINIFKIIVLTIKRIYCCVYNQYNTLLTIFTK